MEWISFAGTVALALALLAAVSKYSYWRGEVDTDRKGFKEFMDEVRSDIKLILGRLPSRVVEGASPVRLTDLGETLAKELDAHTWVVSHAESLLPKCEDLKEYEIYNLCGEHVRSTADEWPENADEVAYDHAMSKENLWDVLAVVLRDEILRRQQDKRRSSP